MPLSYDQLCNIVTMGIITDTPMDHINGASIDVTLGREILIEEDARPFSPRNQTYNPILDFAKRQSMLSSKMMMMGEEGYVLQPGEFILAHTQQKFNLPLNLCARFSMKSTAARCGLENLNACWCDPGWHDSALTLELVNCTRYTPIRIRPGDRIGQMVFSAVQPVPYDMGYGARGRYNNDESVQGPKK